MKLLENNPFRILGVISNATSKEIHEAETYIIRYLDIGKNANLKFDITPPLKEVIRDTDIIQKAKSNIHDDFDKLSHAIFWFINGSTVDKIALDKLAKNKDIENALNTFKKGSRSFEVSKNSYSSIINFSTIEIASYSEHKDQDRLTNAIKYKYQVIKDKKIFSEFEKIITSNSNKIDHKKYVDKFIDNSKNLIKEIFPRKNENKLLLDIFSEDKNIVQELKKQSTSKIEENIWVELNTFITYLARYKDQSNSYIITNKKEILKEIKKLISNTSKNLNELKSILGKDSFQYTNLIDKTYSLLHIGILRCFKAEQSILVNKMKTNSYDLEDTIKSTNFNPYIQILKNASKITNSINCNVKSTINKLLELIQSEGNVVEKCKKEYNYRSTNYTSSNSSYNYSSSNDSEGNPVGGIIIFIIIIIIIANSC